MASAYLPGFETYITPARARPQVWRLIAGILLGLAIYMAFTMALLALAWRPLGVSGPRGLFELIARPDTPTGALVLLFSFLGMALGPLLVVRLLHKRKAGTLFGRGALVIRHFVIAAAVVGTVNAIWIAIWALRFDAIPQLDWSLWLTLLPLSLVGLLLQTGAEELVFRGYLQQQLAARFASPLIWMALPSAIFGALHYDPSGSSGNVWFVVAAAALFGLAAADLTRVTGSLGAAWGFHFANNFAAILIIAVDGSITGLALKTTPYAADAAEVMRPLILVDLAVLALAWLLVRRVLAR